MLKYALYGIFGLVLVGAYALVALTPASQRRMGSPGRPVQAPPTTDVETYRAQPAIWRTGFHGPGARVIDYTPRRRSYGGSGYGGSGGGYGGYGGK